MAFQPRDNSGTLFKNDKKESDKHPDYKGDAIIDGQAVWISAWIKKGQRGTFMSLSFTPKKERGGGNSSSDNRSDRQPIRQDNAEEDEDIPF